MIFNNILDSLGYQIIKKNENISKFSDFSEALLEPTVIDRTTVEYGLTDNDLYEIFKSSDDVHKWHHYFPIYTEKFKRFRDKPIRMLEIGVQKGGSLRLWRKWFHPETVFVGLDINPDCFEFDNPEDNIFVRIGSQTDAEFLDSINQELGPFDIILDDGGHTTGQMITSFNCLFREALKDDGLYLVEDTHTNYVESFIDTDITFVDFCKILIDIMHNHYLITDSPKQFRVDLEIVLLELEIPYLTAWVDSISFYDSIIAIEKRHRPLPSNNCLYSHRNK